MTDLTFSMLDRREEKTNKQTDRQTNTNKRDKQNLAGYFQKKPDDSPQQYLMF